MGLGKIMISPFGETIVVPTYSWGCWEIVDLNLNDMLETLDFLQFAENVTNIAYHFHLEEMIPEK